MGIRRACLRYFKLTHDAKGLHFPTTILDFQTRDGPTLFGTDTARTSSFRGCPHSSNEKTGSPTFLARKWTDSAGCLTDHRSRLE